MEQDSKKLQKRLERALVPFFGKRCKESDLIEFPELENNPKASRCPVCVAYERVDRFTLELMNG